MAETPMRRPRILLTLSAVALAACGSSDPGTTASPGTASAASTTTAASATRAGCTTTGRSTTSVVGAPLSTILRVPAANRTRTAPLVVALHFAGGPGRAMEQATGLTSEARRAGFDACAAGPPSCAGPAATTARASSASASPAPDTSRVFGDIRAAGIDPNAFAWRFLSAHRLT
jgi:predicted alpha/beta-fold hydrolase